MKSKFIHHNARRAGTVLILAGLALAARPAAAQLICAGDLPPYGAAIVATGTSSICGGACRARQFASVHGDTMIICAQQPIPPHYSLQSLTTSPSCQCLGAADNAYVIRADPASQYPRSAASGAGQDQPFQIGE
jgi:hypothetical protein